jgi:hypothetical protein
MYNDDVYEVTPSNSFGVNETSKVCLPYEVKSIKGKLTRVDWKFMDSLRAMINANWGGYEILGSQEQPHKIPMDQLLKLHPGIPNDVVATTLGKVLSQVLTNIHNTALRP